MMLYLIDTNILIACLELRTPVLALENIQKIIDAAGISVINRIEFLGWQGFEAETKKSATLLVNTLKEYPLDTAVAKATITLRAAHKIKLGDALIAATAQVHGLTLVTRNTLDFKNCAIPTYNPFQNEIVI